MPGEAAFAEAFSDDVLTEDGRDGLRIDLDAQSGRRLRDVATEHLREEPGEPLGTGGSLALLPERPEQPVFVCNGDLVTQVDVAGMFGFHEEGGHAATIGVRGYSHEIPFGCLDVSEGRVTSIVEKPAISQLINAGIYILSPEVIGRVPRRHFPITELFEEALRLGDSVGAFEIADEWLDVGQREQLKQARGGAH